MAYTLGTAINIARARYPDLSTTLATTYGNLAHRDIISKLDGVLRDSTTVSLTSGTQEYALLERFMGLDYVTYTTGSTTTTLNPTSVEELDRTNPTWRNDASGTPIYYYTSANSSGSVIGFYPKPGTTTSGGDPIVTIKGPARASADLTTSDNLPDTIPTCLAYSDFMCLQWALANDPPAVQTWLQVYQQDLKELAEYVLRRGNDDAY